MTKKQKRFVEEYLIDLNATQAAIRAGYSPDSAKEIGSENLTKPDILQAIRKRESAQIRPLIATREDRQRFWTEIMRDGEAAMKDRLRASELLGKAAGDFLERMEVESNASLDLRMEVRAALLEREREKREAERDAV